MVAMQIRTGIPGDIVRRLEVLAHLHGREVESEIRWILRAHVLDPARLHDLIGVNGTEDRFDAYIAGSDLTAGIAAKEKTKP